MAVINEVGQLANTGGGSAITVYTCPAGVSKAVVHVYVYNVSASTAYAKLNSVSADATGAFLLVGNNPTLFYTSTASLVLKPGDVIALASGSAVAGSPQGMLVTGYTVP
jgi:hypothetical protein